MANLKPKSKAVFTVFGFYPDTLQRFCGHIRATDATAAERDIKIQHPHIAICGVIAGESNCVDREPYVSLD